MTPFRIVDVYPGSMFPQGDGGNLRALEYRARGRGIDVETVPAPIGDPLPEADLYLLQGAEDEDQPVVARRLREDGTLARAAAAGKSSSASAPATRSSGRASSRPRARRRKGWASSTCAQRSASTWTDASSRSRRHDSACRARRVRMAPRPHHARPRGGAARRGRGGRLQRRRAADRRRRPGPRPRHVPPRAPAARNPELTDLLLGWTSGRSSSRCKRVRRAGAPGAHRGGAGDRTPQARLWAASASGRSALRASSSARRGAATRPGRAPPTTRPTASETIWAQSSRPRTSSRATRRRTPRPRRFRRRPGCARSRRRPGVATRGPAAAHRGQEGDADDVDEGRRRDPPDADPVEDGVEHRVQRHRAEGDRGRHPVSLQAVEAAREQEHPAVEHEPEKAARHSATTTVLAAVKAPRS